MYSLAPTLLSTDNRRNPRSSVEADPAEHHFREMSADYADSIAEIQHTEGLDFWRISSSAPGSKIFPGIRCVDSMNDPSESSVIEFSFTSRMPRRFEISA